MAMAEAPEVPEGIDPLAAGGPLDPRSDPAPTPEEPAKPEPKGPWAGKFDNPETLEQGYKDLQAEHTRIAQELAELKRQGAAPPADPDAEPSMTEPTTAGPMTVEGILARAGVTAKDLGAEMQKGGLSDETIAKFEKAGFAKDVIETFVAGQLAAAQAKIGNIAEMRRQVEQMAGGRDRLDQLLTYKNTLSEAEQANLNERLENPALWQGAVLELQQRIAARAGAAGDRPLVQPTAAAMQTTPRGAQTANELMELMRHVPANGDLSQVPPEIKARIAATPDEIFEAAGR
jgi:hypothetical protein